MNNSGDAAEQVVRLSLEGTEVALKLTGSAAKNVAAAIYAVLKNRDKNKIKGRQRLTAMLKSGKELKVFTVSEEHLKQFATEAKRYGVVYCALRGKGKSADGMVDVMVRAEDASKINRIVERFKLATVDAASIKSEIQQSREERSGSDPSAAPAAPEQAQPEKSEEDRLLDEMLGAPTGREEAAPVNPSAARAEKSPPSAPISEKPSRTAEGTAKKLGSALPSGRSCGKSKPSAGSRMRLHLRKRNRSDPKRQHKSRYSTSSHIAKRKNRRRDKV